jgi:hypothetical protein
MRGVAAAAAVLAVLAAAPAAGGAPKSVTYQGWTSQGREISFRVGAKGVSVMKLTVVATCANGDTVAFALKALDKASDAIRRGRYTTVLASDGAPTATVKGVFNKYATGRGTITATGPAKGRDGRDFGNCATDRPVRWTAGPFQS